MRRSRRRHELTPSTRAGCGFGCAPRRLSACCSGGADAMAATTHPRGWGAAWRWLCSPCGCDSCLGQGARSAGAVGSRLRRSGCTSRGRSRRCCGRPTRARPSPGRIEPSCICSCSPCSRASTGRVGGSSWQRPPTCLASGRCRRSCSWSSPLVRRRDCYRADSSQRGSGTTTRPPRWGRSGRSARSSSEALTAPGR